MPQPSPDGPRLCDLRPGARAVLGAPSSLDATVLRLLEMGMTAGTEVVLTRKAPFGDPLEISLRGTRLVLRRDDAARFPVAPCDGGAP